MGAGAFFTGDLAGEGGDGAAGAVSTFLDETLVVYVRGCTPVKTFFRLRLQNLFPGVHPQTVADG